MSSSNTKVMIERAMLSYPHLVTPQAPRGDSNQKPKFSATFVLAPGTDLSKYQAAAEAAAEEKWPGKGAAALKKGSIRSPFRRDAAEKGYEEGSVFINARSGEKPGCVYLHPDPDVKPDAKGRRPPQIIPDDKIREVLYPGSIVRASLRAFGYDNNGNKGVSFALNNVQKLADGERLDGRVSAEDEFDADLSAVPADLDEVM